MQIRCSARYPLLFLGTASAPGTRVHDTETWYNSQHLITRSISSGHDMLDPGSREKEGQNRELDKMVECWRHCLVLC